LWGGVGVGGVVCPRGAGGRSGGGGGGGGEEVLKAKPVFRCDR